MDPEVNDLGGGGERFPIPDIGEVYVLPDPPPPDVKILWDWLDKPWNRDSEDGATWTRLGRTLSWGDLLLTAAPLSTKPAVPGRSEQ